MSFIFGDPDLFGHRQIIGGESGEISVLVSDRETTDPIIKAGHYSGSVCWASNRCFIVRANELTIGAMQYGPAMNPASGSNIVDPPGRWCELNRLWLCDDKPKNTGSRAISLTLKILRKQGYEWVQSFADERCGKFGAIYRACSFDYLGEHKSTFYQLDGEWFHKSSIGRKDSRGWGIGPKLTRFNQNLDRAQKFEFRQFRFIKTLTGRARRDSTYTPQWAKP